MAFFIYDIYFILLQFSQVKLQFTSKKFIFATT